ncbi:hypothetical protein RRG08_036468 [Elysia crispata]|uniref:Uncharacterized protein n=1 Tax=Elysia crispata TaxID=231223 RepID=A0AAE0ZKD3_9GAST|nr:hypothetical protein RRG08_036468 [Elysia crispata]
MFLGVFKERVLNRKLDVSSSVLDVSGWTREEPHRMLTLDKDTICSVRFKPCSLMLEKTVQQAPKDPVQLVTFLLYLAIAVEVQQCLVRKQHFSFTLTWSGVRLRPAAEFPVHPVDDCVPPLWYPPTPIAGHCWTQVGADVASFTTRQRTYGAAGSAVALTTAAASQPELTTDRQRRKSRVVTSRKQQMSKSNKADTMDDSYNNFSHEQRPLVICLVTT